MLDQLTAVLKQIGAELPARARQIVQRVEVELGGELADYPAQLMWLACVKAESRVHAMAGSRIAAEGGAESINVWVQPLVYHWHALHLFCYRVVEWLDVHQVVLMGRLIVV
jgi:hypothetical protein